MAKKKAAKKAVKKTGPNKSTAYFTTRALERAVSKGSRNKSRKAMKVIGYTVIESEGYIVKKYADGREEKIAKLAITKRPSRLVLD